MVATQRSDFRQRVNSACANRSRRPDRCEGLTAPVAILTNPPLQSGDVHALLIIRGDPPNGIGAEAEHVCSLLNPSVCFLRGIAAQSLRFRARETGLADVPTGLRRSRREETDKVGHVATAHQ